MTSNDQPTQLRQNGYGGVRNSSSQLIFPAALVALIVGFAAFDSRMLSASNLVNVIQQSTYLTVFAMAQAILIVTRGLDLSLGPTVSMVSVAVALTMAHFTGTHAAPLVVILAGVFVGLILGCMAGLFNGVLVATFGVSAFIASLGSYNIAVGVATTISGGRPVQGVPPLFSQVLYSGSPLGLPAAILITVLLAATVHLILSYTVFGRSLYLIGTNIRASEIAGLPTKRYLILAYLLSSALTAIGAMMLTARTGSGEPNLGGSLSLQAIAAAVVGGTSLAGGSGGVGTAVLGALFITILSNGMNLAQVNGYLQMVVLGIIVIAGVVLDRQRLNVR